MARFIEAQWADTATGVPRRDRQHGVFSAYLPDPLGGRPLALSASIQMQSARAERMIRNLRLAEGAEALADIGPMLTRTEAAASSWIEGIPPRARQVAFAELASDEDIRGFGEQAVLVARNASIVRDSVGRLATKAILELDDLLELQRQLLGPDHRALGLRAKQNWIGGSGWHPLDAAYVPPPPEHVGRLMADLVDFANDTSVGALIQAGLVHAQFETIHPFSDGNGRVGRALIHTVLARRGLTSGAVLPVSLVLMTRQAEYIAGLERFRHEGSADGPEATRAAADWLEVFLSAVIDAAAQSRVIAAEVHQVSAIWMNRLRSQRVSSGHAAEPRADAAVLVLLKGLLQAPVMTVSTAQRLFGLRSSAASAALIELAEADVVEIKRDRGRPVYVASDLLALLDLADRRLASPAFDTKLVAPVRPTPTRGPGHPEPPAEADAIPRAWSDAARSVWAKTDADTNDSLSLVRHLEDAAAVAGELWDHWLAPNVRRVISEGLPDGEADGRVLLTWLAGIHDIGKATPGFAIKARNAPGFGLLVDAMSAQGLAFPAHTFGGGEKLPPHCRLGHFLTTEWLAERHDIVGSAAHTFAIPVGAHHGVPPSHKDLQDLRGSQWTGRRDEPWRATQFEILDGMAGVTGADERLTAWAGSPPRPTAQALLSATVVVADWLASDIKRFPYGDARSTADRISTAKLGEDLLEPWLPQVSNIPAQEAFSARFPQAPGHRARRIQQATYDLVGDLDVASLIVIEAPMGIGKTEAALLAAERLTAKFGCGGVFIGLPTMATSDAMFERVLQWIHHLDSDDASSIFLAHGRARLNESYRGLVRESFVQGLDAHEHQSSAESAVVTSWLQGRRKGALANFVVGTIDQALFGALKSRFLALRHLALASKVVIIDEVHAADAYMRRYLVRILEWLGAYGTPVVLLSATLPPNQRQELVAAYARGRQAEPAAPEHTEAYPVITVQGDHTQRHPVAWTEPETSLHVRRLSDDPGELRELVGRLVVDGACVVVIRNTVTRAQDTFADLREAVGPERVSLVHSRLVAADRVAREARLRALLGPPGGETPRPRGFVVVGTQVLEQSLDIDADAMVSDLAPIDLVLQRSGRLHRHQRGAGQADRPAGTREARLYLTGVTAWDDEPPVFASGSRAVYGDNALYRAASVLVPHLDGKPVVMPTDIPRLVTSGYDPQLAPPPLWAEQWASAEREALTATSQQRDRASVFRVWEPHDYPSLVGWMDGRADESDETAGAVAQVRDSEDGLEVVVVWRDADGVVRLLPGPWPDAEADLGIVGAAPPPGRLEMTVMGHTLKLPTFMTRGAAADKVIGELEFQARDFVGWRDSRWLGGQLILCLDARLRAVVAGWAMHYDLERGLIVSKQEELHG